MIRVKSGSYDQIAVDILDALQKGKVGLVDSDVVFAGKSLVSGRVTDRFEDEIGIKSGYIWLYNKDNNVVVGIGDCYDNMYYRSPISSLGLLTPRPVEVVKEESITHYI